MRYFAFVTILAMAVAACGDADSSTTPSVMPHVSTTATTTALPTTEGSTAASTTTTASTTTLPQRSLDDLSLQVFEAGAGFSQPVLMLTAPTDDRWFIVDQPGIIWVVSGRETTVFVDINDLVRFQGEQGLLGMAFHPNYQSNGLVYINYINNNGDTVVASLEAKDDTADRGSLTEILRVDQPAGNHNGGMIVFGPDGNLWVALGDGGGANDQFGHGQRADTLLAAMLRLTVGPGIDGYAIPEGNLANEVWAIGLRNPWRFSFDGDDLWIADVGQNRIEEVDVVDRTAGNPNFGWSELEGSDCFGGGNCDVAGFAAPVYEYSHSDGCSITGGFVYRGQSMPELAGHYFFADYCTGWLRSVDRSGDMREWLPSGTFSGAVGFGVDASGELYVLTAGGKIYGIRAVS